MKEQREQERNVLMKKKLIALILLLLTLLTLTACGNDSASDGENTPKPLSDEKTNENNDDEKTEDNVLDKTKEYNVLFIGNSYTHYNDMPEAIFAAIAKTAGYKFNVKRLTKGGWYLISSANSSDSLGAEVDAELKSKKYDYVIMQEQSTCPALEPGKFYDGVRNLLVKIKENGATPILYGTWGRKTGSSTLNENNWTHESMTWKISAAYEAIGKELGIEVAYAGLAFHDVYTNYASEVDIYDADLTHPSYSGSFLAAMTIFSKITGVDPAKVRYNGQLSGSVTDILREAARKAVFETPEIPEAYKTSSEGVTTPAAIYTIDTSKMKNLKEFPSSQLISVLSGGAYPNGKTFSGILGTKNAISSKEYSTTGLTEAQKADIADIGYGVSVIGIEKMNSSSSGYTTAVENLVNGHWGTSFMACFEFDDKKYNVRGEEDENAQYTGLITLNFGSKHRFDAVGFSSGSLQGFPGVAQVYVSDDGVNWTLVPTAAWDNVNGTKLVSCGKTPADPWNGNSGTVTCLFDTEGITGQYIRIGVIIGRNDTASKYNTINTREILVYGEKID